MGFPLKSSPGSRPKLSRSNASIMCVGIVGIVGALAYSGFVKKFRSNDTENYKILFPQTLTGWRVMPKTPESLFIFRNPKDDFLMRGAVSQVISDVNPTPDLTTEGIAKYYINCTQENLKDWTAQRSPDLPGANVDFSVILRQRKQHTVITAFAVKGNTTLMVSISSPKGTPAVVDRAMADLASCVKSISMTWEDLGGGRKMARQQQAGSPAQG